MNATGLTIGKLAHRCGINVATIRYYERRGLLLKAPRTSSGYRLYTADAVPRLRFIRHAQSLGFSLDEIQELLSMRVRPDTTCADIRSRARNKIAAIDRKIGDLARIRTALARLAAACHGRGPTATCPILDALEGSGEPA